MVTTFNFRGIAKLFSKAAAPFSFPSAIYEGPIFSTSSPTHYYLSFFYDNHPSGCEMVFHCAYPISHCPQISLLSSINFQPTRLNLSAFLMFVFGDHIKILGDLHCTWILACQELSCLAPESSTQITPKSSISLVHMADMCTQLSLPLLGYTELL